MSGRIIRAVQIFKALIDGKDVIGPVFPRKEIKFFQDAMSKFSGVAPTPGTFDPATMSVYGAIGVPYNATLQAAHIHQTVDGSSGTNTVELWRIRAGVMTMIASGSLIMGGGDFAVATLTITDDSLLQNDYIYMQPTSVATGGTPRATVDAHLNYTGGS